MTGDSDKINFDLLLQRSIAEYKQKQNEVKILNIGTDFNDT